MLAPPALTARCCPCLLPGALQSKDIAHTQKYVAERFAAKARSSEGGPWSRTLARMTLAGLPRGGGNGDDIRMGILHIMRGNGIKEGHRPVRRAVKRVWCQHESCNRALH